jgi:hypothetical protein
MLRLLSIALVVMFSTAEESSCTLQPTLAGSPQVVAAANWAVSELQKLSASNIYTTLSLAGIDKVATSDGVYHDNTLLNLRLSSPHFDSKLPEEGFDVMIMQHKTEGHRK